MEKLGWKITAIVSIVLLILAIASIVVIFKASQSYELKRQKCAYDVCGMREQLHDSYFFAEVDDYCYCFNAGKMEIAQKISLD